MEILRDSETGRAETDRDGGPAEILRMTAILRLIEVLGITEIWNENDRDIGNDIGITSKKQRKRRDSEIGR
jgi:cytochrome b